jgi:hypothetical protein
MCGRHMHPDSAGRREADFAIRVAARLFDIDLSVIQVQLELGTIWYAVPGPFGPIPKNYPPANESSSTCSTTGECCSCRLCSISEGKSVEIARFAL